MATGEYKLIKINGSASFDEKTIQAENGKALGFNSALDPVMLDVGSLYTAANSTEVNTGSDSAKYITPAALFGSKYRMFEVQAAAPVSPTLGMLWIDTDSAGFTESDISNWNTAYSWGNHSTAGYLTSFTESDPKGVYSMDVLTYTGFKELRLTLNDASTVSTYIYIDEFDSPMTSAADLIIGGSGGNPMRLGVGTTGQVLTVTGTNTVGWSSASGVSGGLQDRIPYFTSATGLSYTNVQYDSINGRIGIGVTPTKTLDVNGDTRINGDLYFNAEGMSRTLYFSNAVGSIGEGTGDNLLLTADALTIVINGSGGTAGQVLTSDGYGATAWQDPPSGGATALSSLTDTTINTPSDGNILGYYQGKWANLTPANLGLSTTSHTHDAYVDKTTAQTVAGIKTFSSNLGIGSSPSTIWGSSSLGLVVTSFTSGVMAELTARSHAGAIGTLYADYNKNCHVGTMNSDGKLYIKSGGIDAMEISTLGVIRMTQYGAGYLKTNTSGVVSSGMNFWYGTSYDYGLIASKDSNTIYFVTDY